MTIKKKKKKRRLWLTFWEAKLVYSSRPTLQSWTTFVIFSLFSGLRYALQSTIIFPVTYYFDPFLNYVEGLKDLKNNNIEYVFQKTEKSNGTS